MVVFISHYRNRSLQYLYSHYYFPLFLQQIIRIAPDLIKTVLDCIVSMKRIENFLLAEEIDPSIIQTSDDSKIAIKIKNGNFYWISEKEKLIAAEKNKPENKEKTDEQLEETIKHFIKLIPEDKMEVKPKNILKDINLKIEKGSFIAVLGE